MHKLGKRLGLTILTLALGLTLVGCQEESIIDFDYTPGVTQENFDKVEVKGEESKDAFTYADVVALMGSKPDQRLDTDVAQVDMFRADWIIDGKDKVFSYSFMDGEAYAKDDTLTRDSMYIIERPSN